MESDTTSYIEYPDKFRVEAQTAFGQLVSGFDGQRPGRSIQRLARGAAGDGARSQKQPDA